MSNIPIGVWIVVGLCALVLALPFVSYVVAKFAQMGRLAGTKSYISFRNKQE